MMKYIFCLAILSLLQVAGLAQSKVVSAGVSTQSILIGEPIELTLKATLPPSVRNKWFDVDSIPHFEILKRSAIDTSVAVAGLTLQQTITLTSWDSGNWLIPALSLAGFRTSALPVAVGHSPMDYNQPYHDVKDIVQVQKQRSSNWYWYLLGVAVLIALFMLFFPAQKKQVAKDVFIDADAYKKAMQQLSQLDVQAEPKLYYTALVDVLRNYLFRRKGIQSFSKTTDDLSLQIKEQLQLPQDRYQQLVQTLRLSDAVKFARFVPGVEENKASLAVVKESIGFIEKGNH